MAARGAATCCGARRPTIRRQRVRVRRVGGFCWQRSGPIERARHELAVDEELTDLGGRAGQRHLCRRVERGAAVVDATGQHRRRHQPVVRELHPGQAGGQEVGPHLRVVARQSRLHAVVDRRTGCRAENAREPQPVVRVPRGQVAPVDESPQLLGAPGQRRRRRPARHRTVGGRRQDLRPRPVLLVRGAVEARLDERAEVCGRVRRAAGAAPAPRPATSSIATTAIERIHLRTSALQVLDMIREAARRPRTTGEPRQTIPSGPACAFCCFCPVRSPDSSGDRRPDGERRRAPLGYDDSTAR